MTKPFERKRITAEEAAQIKVGDYIRFVCLIAYREHRGRCKVNGFYRDGRPTVRCNGFSDFIVNFDEIVRVEVAP